MHLHRITQGEHTVLESGRNNSLIMTFQGGLTIERWDRFRWLLALSLICTTVSLALLVPGAVNFDGQYDFHFYSGIIALLFAIGIFIMWFACQIEVMDECTRFLDEEDHLDFKQASERPHATAVSSKTAKQNECVPQQLFLSRSSSDLPADLLDDVASLSSDYCQSGSEGIFCDRSRELPCVESDKITEDSLNVIEECPNRTSRSYFSKRSTVYPSDCHGTKESSTESQTARDPPYLTDVFVVKKMEAQRNNEEKAALHSRDLAPLKTSRENPAFDIDSQNSDRPTLGHYKLPPIQRISNGKNEAI